MSQFRILCVALSLSLCLGEAQAQKTISDTQAPSQPETASEEGFGETYGEQVEREQDEIEAQAKAAEENTNSVLATVPQDNSIDYQGIANAVFAKSQPTQASTQAVDPIAENQPKTYEDITYTLTDNTSKATLGMGHTIELKLRTSSNLKWNFDKEFKSLEFLSEDTKDEYLHITFKAKAPGQETLYFDCLDVGDPLNIKVLETKLMIITVE